MESSLVALGIIVLFVVLFVWMVYAGKQEQKKRAEIAQTLGLTPVADPHAELLERLAALQISYGSPKYQLRNVLRKSIPFATLYLYDMWDIGGKSSTSIQSSAVAVVAPGMKLPFFMVYPRLASGAMLANLANQLIENVISMQGMTEIEFPDIPALDEKFFIVGDNPEAVRALFSPGLASLLAQKPTIGIQASGDTISISHTFTRSTLPTLEATQEIITHASAVYDYLSRFS